MKSKWNHILLLVVVSVGAVSCSVTKNIPEGKYLLDRVTVDIDNKNVDQASLTSFIRQKPNDPKFRIYWYDWAGQDSSRIKNWVRNNLGKPPVIFDQAAMTQSVKEIRAEMKNLGYLNNTVTTRLDTVGDKKRMRVTYVVDSQDPYRIRDYDISMPNPSMDSLVERRVQQHGSLLKKESIFDMNRLEEERSQISSLLRNQGYFTSTKDNLHYLADTALHSNQVDLALIYKDSTQVHPFYIRNVIVRSGYDPIYMQSYHPADSVNYRGIEIIYDRTHFMREKTLYENILVKPGDLYSERRGTRTYDYLMSLGSISRAGVQYQQVDSALVDCNIYLTPGNIHEVQLGLEGTNKAGDLGVGALIAYTHRNIFNGAEAWNIKLKGAYEFVSGSVNEVLTHNFYEVGVSTGLMFPNVHIPFLRNAIKERLNVHTTYEVSFDIQQRPEYTRDFFNFSWKNHWENRRKTLSQTFNIVDINYVMMPYISSEFRNYLNQEENSLTKYSYENVFTAGQSYSIVYTNPNTGRYRQRLYTIRFNAESSGNLLNGIFRLTNAKKSNSGQYNILGNPYAQYLKGDFSYAQTVRFDEKNSVAYHFLIGAAYPYGNSSFTDSLGVTSSILPFEKRYYAGGPNSVRGWSTRYLGPGSYNGDEGNPATHVGDLKLELSVEYRHKVIKWLELAGFVDAGNIWTIRAYENQAGGQWTANRFYREIAMGTGIGVRFDLSFLIIRLDAAKRVYDPAKPEKERWTFLKERWKGNSEIYFAIGYPF